MEKVTKIAYLHVCLKQDGLKIETDELDCQETKSLYKLFRDGEFIRQLQKDEISAIKHNFGQSTFSIGYSSFVLPENVETTKQKMIQSIEEYIEIFDKQLQNLKKGLANHKI